MKNKSLLFGKLMTLVGVLVFAAILALSYYAVGNMARDYRALRDADLSQDFTKTIAYDDHLYVTLGYGIEMDQTVSDRPAFLEDFLTDSLYGIEQRVFSAGILYTMVVSVIMAYGVYQRHREKRKRYIADITLLTVILYLLYQAAVCMMFHIRGIPWSLPQAIDILPIVTCLICVIGGNAALAWLLRTVRFKKATAVAVIPVVFILFLFGMLFEAGLWNRPAVDSMNSFALSGAKRYGAYLYELVDPYSGSSLYMAEQALDTTFSRLVYLIYALKGMFWAALAAIFSN